VAGSKSLFDNFETVIQAPELAEPALIPLSGRKRNPKPFLAGATRVYEIGRNASGKSFAMKWIDISKFVISKLRYFFF
jgi:hypothetical protein